MSDPVTLDDLRERSKPNRLRCTVGTMLEQANEQTTTLINGALAAAADPEDRMSYEGLASWLREEGHTIDGQTLSRHNRGVCRCPR